MMLNSTEIKKIVLVYFSGTGNTKHMAEYMRKLFSEREVDCNLIALETILMETTSVSWTDYDLIGFAYPVHAFDAPKIVYDLIEKLPVAPLNYFFFKTAGSIFQNGGSSRRLRLDFSRKGWLLRHEAVYELPPNMGVPSKPAKINAMLEKAYAQMQISVEQILSGIRVVLKDDAIKRGLALINRLETKGLTRFSSKWTVSSACIKCGLCVRNCPTQNISMTDDNIQFSDKCIFCLRCQWNCPVRAIDHKYVSKVLMKEPYKLNESKP